MPLIIPSNSISDGGYVVDNSLRFNESDDCLIKTFGSAGNRKLWTYSVWFKRGKLGGSYALFVAGASGDDEGTIRIEADKIDWQHYDVGTSSVDAQLLTSQVIRDPSAWYNLQCVYDSANATAGDRMKMFLNGSEITSFSTDNNPSLNYDSAINNNVIHNIGRQTWNNSADFSGYMAEVCFIDGQALDPTSFGEFDEDSGIWKPINVSGLTFGTNGFYLDFENSGSLGADVSGNGNNFTVNNLTAIDQSTDTCTNNFATLNPLTSFAGTFEEGNLKTTGSDDTVSTIGLTSGKWYWEAQRTNTSNQAHFGIGCSNGFFSATSVVSNGDYVYIRGDATYGTASRVGGITSIGSNGGTPATFTTGDILSFSLDLDSATKNITIKKNNGGTPLVDTDFSYDGSIPIFVYSRMNSGVGASFNFGNPINTISSGNTDGNGYGNFEYAVPSGYLSLCTKNLSEVLG